MLFADALTLDAPRRTADGYLVARARAARAGVYAYAGREVDPTGQRFAADAAVNVYRPESEVFDQASVASFLMKPVTNDHPRDPVTADNWRQHAKGVVGKALRDGEHLAFDLVLMDAATIADVESGKRELSNGYACELAFEDGTAPDGTAYQAIQRQIRGNHVAVVDRGRAGPTCRIGDAAPCVALPSPEIDRILADQRTYDLNGNNDKSTGERRETSKPFDGGSQVATKTITFDGLPLEVTDAAEAAINKLIGQLADAASAKAAGATELAALKTDLAARDAEIVTLKQQVTDAKVTPAQLRDAAKAYAQVCDKAKALGVTFAEDADAAAIMHAVVSAKMGDAAKSWTQDQIAASFAVLTKDAKPADPLRDTIAHGVVNLGDARADYEAARDEHRKNLSSAWKKPATTA